jgi:MraZ protein
MALFLSTFENKIDKMGRVSVPSTFRSAVTAANNIFNGVILYRSFTDNCIEGCDITRMETLSNAADDLDIFSKQQDDLTALIFSDARELSFDTTGRILLPKDLIEHADLNQKALFVGRGKTFQIWNPKVFVQKENEVRAKASKERPTLKLPKSNNSDE